MFPTVYDMRVHTENSYRYDSVTWNVEATTAMVISVQACNDAHVALSTIGQNTDTLTYEVVLSGYKNTYSFIRRSLQGNAVAVSLFFISFKGKVYLDFLS